jgi:hypothetical protein
MIMKKILLLLTLVAGALSCTKILDTKPTDFLAPETYYNDSTQVNNALTAVYDALQKNNLYTGGDGLLTVYNVTDEMFFGSSGSGPKIYNYTGGEVTALNMWSACYMGISRANLLLDNIDRAAMDSVKQRRARGEAKFLRAYFYFVLVQNWGGVPLVTKAVHSVNQVNIARTPEKEVYDFIISEMTEAEAMVAPITAYNHAGRITQSAVQGILARVCLYKAGWPNNDVAQYQNALNWAKKAMGSGLHALNKSYPQVFINLVQNLYDTKESIWEIEYYTTGTGDVYTEYVGSLNATLGVNQTNLALGYVGGSYRIQQHLYNLYQKDSNVVDSLIPDKSVDLRRDWDLAPFKYAVAPAKVYYTAAQIYDRQPNKWDRIYELTANKFQSSSGMNTCMIRYADILLMAAEAENEINGPTQFAIDAVNDVRRRGYGKYLNGEGVKLLTLNAGGTGYTTATVSISGGGGTGATAKAVLTAGVVTGVTLTNHGTGYTSVPTITITGDGTGADVAGTISVITDADLTPDMIASQEALRQAIRDERARELCFEGWRRLDLRRWGVLISTMKDVANEANASTSSYKAYAAIPGTNISETHLYLPIPINEMALNKLLIQNPGW